MTGIINLVAGTSGSYAGYGRTGSAYATGSISAEPFDGQTLIAFLTSASGDFIQLNGNTVATFLDTAVSVAGRVWTIAQPGTFASGVTQYAVTTSGSEFASGTSYSIATGALGGALHAVTQDVIHGPDTSPALPAVSSERRRFATQREASLSAAGRYMAIKVSVPNASGWPGFLVLANNPHTNNVQISGADFWIAFAISTEDATNGNRKERPVGLTVTVNNPVVFEAWYDAGANLWRGAVNGIATSIDITGYDTAFTKLIYCLYDGGTMDLHRSVILDRVPTTGERAELRDFVMGPVPPVITSANSALLLHGSKLSIPLTSDQVGVTFSINGAQPDGGDFEIGSGDVLRFLGDANANYDSPTDSDTNNVYVLSVTAYNASTGLSVDQTITVTVEKLIYRGGQVPGRAGATTATNIGYALTGGTHALPQPYDTVVLFCHIGSTIDEAVVIGSGFTKHDEIFSNGTSYDSNMALFTKKMGAVPDTLFSLGSSGNAKNAQNCYITCWAGVDETTPFDVAIISALFSGTAKPNPPSVTPVTNGAVILMCAGGAAATTAAWTAPAYLTAFRSVTTADTIDSVIGGGYRRWKTGDGAYDGAVWAGGGTAASANAASIYVVVLRPAAGAAIDYRYKGASWAARYLGGAAENVRYQGAQTLHS